MNDPKVRASGGGVAQSDRTGRLLLGYWSGLANASGSEEVSHLDCFYCLARHFRPAHLV